MEINLIIEKSPAFTKTSPGVYRGISKQFYPRWEGWKLLDNLGSLKEVDSLAVEFYKTFYYYRFKLDLLEDVVLAELLMSFCTLEGPKKTLQKIQKVLPEVTQTVLSQEVIDILNTKNSNFTKLLILELIEFYEYTKKLQDSVWLVSIYRKIA